jgi:hypothetical protein
MAEPRDDELAAELRALGAWIATPEPPDVRAAVRARLASAPQPSVRAERPPRFVSPWWRRRWVAVAAALAVALVVGLLPPGRAAVAHAVTGLLRFAGIEVRQGQPVVPATPSPLPSARSAALDEARRLARFPVRVPDRLGVPDDVVLADPAPDGAPRVVSLLYRGGTIRLDQFDGELDPLFIKTASGPDTEWLKVNGRTALWFPSPHALTYIDRHGVHHEEAARRAAPTLVWAEGSVTYRLEGAPGAAEAVAIAATLR